MKKFCRPVAFLFINRSKIYFRMIILKLRVHGEGYLAKFFKQKFTKRIIKIDPCFARKA